MKATLVALLLVACSVGTGDPALCPNGWVILDYRSAEGKVEWDIAAPEGHCLRASTDRVDLRFFSDASCSDGRSCAIVMPGDSVIAAGPYLLSGQLGLIRSAPLRGDGSCPLACPGGGP